MAFSKNSVGYFTKLSDFITIMIGFLKIPIFGGVNQSVWLEYLSDFSDRKYIVELKMLLGK